MEKQVAKCYLLYKIIITHTKDVLTVYGYKYIHIVTLVSTDGKDLD